MTIPIIIDTDPGVDDAVALMLAATSPEAELLAELAARIECIVIMGGHLDEDASSEFNISSDPEATHRVLVEEDVPATLVPLDLTL